MYFHVFLALSVGTQPLSLLTPRRMSVGRQGAPPKLQSVYGGRTQFRARLFFFSRISYLLPNQFQQNGLRFTDSAISRPATRTETALSAGSAKPATEGHFKTGQGKGRIHI